MVLKWCFLCCEVKKEKEKLLYLFFFLHCQGKWEKLENWKFGLTKIQLNRQFLVLFIFSLFPFQYFLDILGFYPNMFFLMHFKAETSINSRISQKPNKNINNNIKDEIVTKNLYNNHRSRFWLLTLLSWYLRREIIQFYWIKVWVLEEKQREHEEKERKENKDSK